MSKHETRQEVGQNGGKQRDSQAYHAAIDTLSKGLKELSDDDYTQRAPALLKTFVQAELQYIADMGVRKEKVDLNLDEKRDDAVQRVMKTIKLEANIRHGEATDWQKWLGFNPGTDIPSAKKQIMEESRLILQALLISDENGVAAKTKYCSSPVPRALSTAKALLEYKTLVEESDFLKEESSFASGQDINTKKELFRVIKQNSKTWKRAFMLRLSSVIYGFLAVFGIDVFAGKLDARQETLSHLKLESKSSEGQAKTEPLGKRGIDTWLVIARLSLLTGIIVGVLWDVGTINLSTSLFQVSSFNVTLALPVFLGLGLLFAASATKSWLTPHRSEDQLRAASYPTKQEKILNRLDSTIALHNEEKGTTNLVNFTHGALMGVGNKALYGKKTKTRFCEIERFYTYKDKDGQIRTVIPRSVSMHISQETGRLEVKQKGEETQFHLETLLEIRTRVKREGESENGLNKERNEFLQDLKPRAALSFSTILILLYVSPIAKVFSNLLFNSVSTPSVVSAGLLGAVLVALLVVGGRLLVAWPSKRGSRRAVEAERAGEAAGEAATAAPTAAVAVAAVEAVEAAVEAVEAVVLAAKTAAIEAVRREEAAEEARPRATKAEAVAAEQAVREAAVVAAHNAVAVVGAVGAAHRAVAAVGTVEATHRAVAALHQAVQGAVLIVLVRAEAAEAAARAARVAARVAAEAAAEAAARAPTAQTAAEIVTTETLALTEMRESAGEATKVAVAVVAAAEAAEAAARTARTARTAAEQVGEAPTVAVERAAAREVARAAVAARAAAVAARAAAEKAGDLAPGVAGGVVAEAARVAARAAVRAARAAEAAAQAVELAAALAALAAPVSTSALLQTLTPPAGQAVAVLLEGQGAEEAGEQTPPSDSSSGQRRQAESEEDDADAAQQPSYVVS